MGNVFFFMCFIVLKLNKDCQIHKKNINRVFFNHIFIDYAEGSKIGSLTLKLVVNKSSIFILDDVLEKIENESKDMTKSVIIYSSASNII